MAESQQNTNTDVTPSVNPRLIVVTQKGSIPVPRWMRRDARDGRTEQSSSRPPKTNDQ